MSLKQPGKAGGKLKPSVMPLHHQLYITLRQRLLDGSFPRDKPLPGELRLSEEFGVSRATLRRTFDALQKDGLITRRHGSGTYPTTRKASSSKSNNKQLSYSEYLFSVSREYRHELVQFEYLPTPHFLDAAPDQLGGVVLKIVRVGFIRNQPAHLITDYTPGRLGELIDRKELKNFPIIDVLQKNGVVIDSTQLLISACAAGPVESEHLDMPIGSPLIRSDRISKQDGSIVDHDVILSRPDLFQYSFVSNSADETLRPGRP